MLTLEDSLPPWTDQDLVLFHGTTRRDADNILQTGVRVSRGLPGRDFGRGFYTTTIQRQAETWAKQKATERSIADPTESPAIIVIEVRRRDISRLEVLAFVSGDDRSLDYWSFVHHCRNERPDHARSLPSDRFYDVVFGPVSSFWKQRLIMPGDQISFHTPAAESVLNSGQNKRILLL